jgi:flavin-dependent dehydrogenase
MNQASRRVASASNRAAEIIIIGGSIAGLHTATLLAHGGGKVHLFDANDVNHVQPRTLIATAQLAEALGYFPGEAVVNEVRSIDLHAAGRSVRVPLPKADLIVERAVLISMLAKRARAAGVNIHPGQKFLGFEGNGDGVNVQLRDKTDNRIHEFSTQCLIGADGAFSKVASVAQLNGQPRVPLLQAIVELPAGYDASNVSVWFEPEQTRYFYWLIPENATRAAVGLIADASTGAKQKLERFLHVRGFKAAEIQAAWIPLSQSAHKPWRRISGCDIYLVGDAAGHVKVTTVGGLVTGLWGARAAADSILKQIPYATALRPLNRELWLHDRLRRVLNRFHAADYDQLLHAIDASTARLLGRHNRDELTALALKLVFTQPRLLGFLPRLFGPARIAESLPQPEAIHQATPST